MNDGISRQSEHWLARSFVDHYREYNDSKSRKFLLICTFFCIIYPTEQSSIGNTQHASDKYHALLDIDLICV